jgi:hypothetical protein
VVRYYNAWVEHVLDKREIDELDFASSDESLDEVEEESIKPMPKPFAGLSGSKGSKFSRRSRFMSHEAPFSAQ